MDNIDAVATLRKRQRCGSGNAAEAATLRKRQRCGSGNAAEAATLRKRQPATRRVRPLLQRDAETAEIKREQAVIARDQSARQVCFVFGGPPVSTALAPWASTPEYRSVIEQPDAFDIAEADS